MTEQSRRLLEASQVTMRFGGLKALDRVDLDLDSDEILGLIGPNGAGKTTFFNLVTGMYRATAGDIRFRNENIVGHSPQKIAQSGIVRTFQQSRLWEDLSILDNLLLGMYMRPRPGLWRTFFSYRDIRRDLKDKTDEALDVAAVFDPTLADGCLRKVKELSLVDRRRIEIIRALLARPALLLLDEPSAGMDPSETRQLMDDITKMKQNRPGLSIIIIEHDMMVISSIAERVIILNFGKKIAEGSFEELRTNPEVIEAYLGQEACHA